MYTIGWNACLTHHSLLIHFSELSGFLNAILIRLLIDGTNSLQHRDGLKRKTKSKQNICVKWVESTVISSSLVLRPFFRLWNLFTISVCLVSLTVVASVPHASDTSGSCLVTFLRPAPIPPFGRRDIRNLGREENSTWNSYELCN